MARARAWCEKGWCYTATKRRLARAHIQASGRTSTDEPESHRTQSCSGTPEMSSWGLLEMNAHTCGPAHGVSAEAAEGFAAQVGISTVCTRAATPAHASYSPRCRLVAHAPTSGTGSCRRPACARSSPPSVSAPRSDPDTCNGRVASAKCVAPRSHRHRVAIGADGRSQSAPQALFLVSHQDDCLWPS